MLRIGFASGPPPDGAPLGRLAEPTQAIEGGRRVVAVPLPDAPGPAALHEAGAALAAGLIDLESAVIDARALPAEAAASLAAGAALRAGPFDLRTHREEPRPRLSALTLHVDAPEHARAAWERIAPGVAGARLAARLAAEPANLLTPRILAERLAEMPGVKARILKPRHLRALGFGALLGVAQGSAEAARVLVLERPGDFRARPLVLVGKGVTFDTGGISIKPAHGMETMKADMAGAAAIAGCMQALAARDSPAPVVAVLGLVENMPGSAAQRPGDVVQAADGSTIEIIDTDAEGRLVLADCLAWARRTFDPVAMIDAATLTGSIVVALGRHRAGLFASDAALAAAIAAAGEAVGERVWPMPLDARHAEVLESPIADIRHCATGRLLPDACHAAAFLHRFAGETPWAHLDIAGVDWRAEADAAPWAPGPTGWGARLLDRLVAQRFEDPDFWPEAGH